MVAVNERHIRIENMLAASLTLQLPIAPQIYRELRQSIITMELKPGQRLSEKEISLRLEVSRQPVREAFIKLVDAGLVEVLPQRGTYVLKISARAVMNARFVREAVEVAVIREAAGRLPPSFFAQMDALIGRQRDAAEANDFESFLQMDEEFHRAFPEAIERDHAWRIVEAEKAQMDRVRYLSLPGVSPMKKLISQHRAILMALRRNDVIAAEKAVRKHLSEVLAALPPIAKKYPDLFDDTKFLRQHTPVGK